MIEAQNLTRQFGNFTAVKRVSLRVPDGSILALLGPNGAGKTTTVRMLAGLIAPSAGSALVGGYDIHKQATQVRACVGLVTDVPGLYETMNPVEYLSFFGQIYGMSPQARRRKADELLELFELQKERTTAMAGFSKGMKQKVALARALLHDPRVLFLDEPTSGLDPLASRGVRDLIVQLKHSQRSIILCTHDLDEAERLADEVAIIRQGEIVLRGTPAELRTSATRAALVRVEFAEPFSQALSVLSAIPEAIEPDVAEDSLSVQYRTTDAKVTNPQVHRQLVELGAQLVSSTVDKNTLEDVYASVMEELSQDRS